jgi:periplasmic divalent cation tolerance protein
MVNQGAAPEPAGDLTLVLTTVAEPDDGELLVRQLVEERLIACGNLVPGLLSIFRWEEEVSREAEVLVLMKAPASGVGRLFERIGELHPYSVPELLALPVASVSRAYCRWVIESTEVSE